MTGLYWIAWLCLSFNATASSGQLESIRMVRSLQDFDIVTHEVVRDIAIDPDGSLWMATFGHGILHYNGKSHNVLNRKDGLIHDSVRALAFDPSGGLWIGTTDGISYYDGRHFTNFTSDAVPLMIEDGIFTITPLRDGSIWFGSEKGYIYSWTWEADGANSVNRSSLASVTPEHASRLSTGNWKLVAGHEITDGENIRKIVEAADGTVWIAMNNKGVLCRKNDDWKFLPSETGVPGKIIIVHAGPYGSVWMSVEKSLYRLENGQWLKRGEFDTQCTCLLQADSGEMFVGTIGGLYWERQGEWIKQPLRGTLLYPRIEALAQDRQGNIWIGTSEGAYQLGMSGWSIFSKSPDGSQLQVSTMVADFAHPPILLDENNRFYQYHNSRFVPVGQIHATDTQFLNATAIVNGRFWIANYDYAFEYSIEDYALLRKIPIVQDDPHVFKLFQTSRGDVWLLTNEGAFILKDEQWIPFPNQEGYKRSYVLDMTEAADGKLWVCMDGRVEIWDGDTIQNIPLAETPLEEARILNILSTRNGEIWIGTAGEGVFRYNGSQWFRYTTKEGLGSNQIMSLYESSDGTLWAGGRSAGISSFDSNEHDRHGRWIHYTRNEGVPDGRVLTIGEYPKGNMWFGIQNAGIVNYTPDLSPPDTQIERAPDRIIPNGIGVFAFFGSDAWNRTEFEELEYSWRIVNSDTGKDVSPWSNFTRTRTATVGPLDPGQYRFEVRVADKDRNIDPSPDTIPFRVYAPVWKEPWFVFLTSLLVASFLLQSIRVIKRGRELEAANLQLSKKIKDGEESERQLIEAMAAAEAATVAKSQFLANMSHEIRTPLNGVIGMLGLLNETNLSEEQQNYMQTCRNSAESLLLIVDDILDFSKIEAGKFELDSIDFELRSCLENTMDILSVKAFEKGLELLHRIDRNVPRYLRGDPGRIRQIFYNLIGNAIKFTHTGEVEVHVSLHSETDNHAVIRVEVRDTGIGIPLDKQDLLFQSFSQLDSTPTRRYGGTGLGLAISKELVEKMGGSIGIRNREHRGSIFWFTAVLEKQIPPPPLPDGDTSVFSSARILIVDDNATNRSILHDIMKYWGCDVSEVDNGADALQLLQQEQQSSHPFDVAIIDYHLPGMDGERLGITLHNDPQLQELKTILLTSIGRRGDAARFREAGFNAFLTKPVKESHLYECLSTILSPIAASVVTNTTYNERPEIANQHPVRHTRILLVEDNPTNQLLAIQVLSKMGYEVHAVHNGENALELLDNQSFDLILMDCQMPVLDGYKTTQEIRRRESKHRHTPIIAMTAHALSGDRERCIAAGMDDYISKPIDFERLELTIEHCLGRVPTTAASHVRDLPDYDWDTVFNPEILLGKIDCDRKLYAELLEIFTRDTMKSVDVIQIAVHNRNMATAEKFAHRLKGMAANMTAMSLSYTANQIETAARENRINDLASWCERLKHELDSLVNAISQEDK